MRSYYFVILSQNSFTVLKCDNMNFYSVIHFHHKNHTFTFHDFDTFLNLRQHPCLQTQLVD